MKAYDDSEFPVRLGLTAINVGFHERQRLMRQGLVTACAELAYEGLGAPRDWLFGRL